MKKKSFLFHLKFSKTDEVVAVKLKTYFQNKESNLLLVTSTWFQGVMGDTPAIPLPKNPLGLPPTSPKLVIPSSELTLWIKIIYFQFVFRKNNFNLFCFWFLSGLVSMLTGCTFSFLFLANIFLIGKQVRILFAMATPRILPKCKTKLRGDLFLFYKYLYL
jgi:hypothetical protein